MSKATKADINDDDRRVAYAIFEIMNPYKLPKLDDVAALIAAHRIAAVADDTWKAIR